MVNVIVQSNGTSGPRGNSLLNGIGAPSSAVGIDGDWYVDTTNYPATSTWYGPKAAGAWPATGTAVSGGLNGVILSGTPAAGKGIAATASLAASWFGQSGIGPWIFNVATYGAVGDGKMVTDGAMASGSPTLTSATASFTSADVGKAVMVKGAGSVNATTLVTTISGFTSATTVTLAAANASGSAVSGALVMWGTDDTAHIQAAINAAVAYASVHGSAKVFIPVGAGSFYAIAGPLVTGGSTLGNAQLTLGAPVVTTANKVVLDIEGVANGSGLEHWQQTVPQVGGSTLVSFGVFASAGAQTTSINASGNPCVIGGPAQPGGYGISPGVFSNMLVTLRNLSILTTHSASGLTYSAADFSGLAEANLFDFAYGTTGTVPGNDFASVGGFANGLSIGVLMPANGNNDNNACRNVSCHGGYTFAFFATEHTVCDRMCILYCWSGLCPVGLYNGSVGSTHGIRIEQLSIEACTNVINIIGVGSSGIGPWVYIDQLDTEISNPTFTDRTSGTGLNAALGTIRLTGLYTPSSVTVTAPTGLKIINGQQAYPVTVVTSNYTVHVTDQTILVDASAGPVTINLISAAWTPNTYTIKKIDSSANPVTATAASGEHIDGATTQTITSQWGKLNLAPARVSSAWNWYTT